MSVYGIGGGLAGVGGLGLPRERGVESAEGGESQVARGGGAQGSAASSSIAQGVGPRQMRGLEPATLPSEAPAGTDPELWSVLTTEERAFYARSQAMGPLTYGRGEVQRAQDSIGLGGRLDLRV